MLCLVVLSLSSYLRRLPESEVEEEIKPLKLPGVLSTMTGTVLYPDEESAKWDVDGMCKSLLNMLRMMKVGKVCSCDFLCL